MDWVLGYINKDDFGLFNFDGIYFYEYEDIFKRENIIWGIVNLDFNKGIIKSFMMFVFIFWMDYFYVDGFRIDVVFYLFYYLGDEFNGINEEVIVFLKEILVYVFSKDEIFILFVEDLMVFLFVIKLIFFGGIGFNYKWNMGFMNDVLFYFKFDLIYRKYNYDKLIFGLVYVFNE